MCVGEISITIEATTNFYVTHEGTVSLDLCIDYVVKG